MLVPLSWLREFVEISMPAEDLAHRLTMAGIEVGSVEHIGAEWTRIVIGRVLEVERHPNADNLFVAKVDVGEEITLVTAAPNLQVGFVVPVIRPGGRFAPGREIEGRRFRGIMSEGMLCSGAELGVSADDKQIYVLEPEAPVGVELSEFLRDAILEVELTANRSDCLGVLGIAREVSALTGNPVTLPWANQLASSASLGEASPLKVFVDDPDLCPRYTARYLENVRIGPSPQWMQRRLHLAGVRPISNVVDVTNYVMLELGQPQHAFDADSLQQATIRVRRARPGEKLTTIDGTERELTGDMLVIADATRPVGLAGVMGGGESEIGDGTTRVVLESATFNGTSIRKTSRSLKLATEASKRFDKGLDVELPALASDRAVTLLAELAGARPLGPLIDIREAPPAPRHITFSPSDITRLIGHTYPDDQIEGILGRLGFDLQHRGNAIDATVPTWRGDVEGKADIAEEVARIVGYDAIPTVLPSGQLPSTHEDPAIRWDEIIRTALAEAGLQEVITYSLVDPYALSRLDPTSDYPNAAPDAETIPIANPQSIDRSRLRRTLLPSLLSTVASNLRHESRVAIFESARIFLPPMDPLPREERRLSIALAGKRSAAGWNPEPGDLDFYDLKAAIEAALTAAHISFEVAPFAGEPWLHPGQAAAITLQGETKPIGFMGQVHPKVTARFDIDDVRVYAAEIELDAILSRAGDELDIRSIPRFPAVARDLALIVEKGVTHQQAISSIQAAGGPLLEAVELFDVYDGAGIPEGQVSLAFSMQFRAPDRTLEDQEVNVVMDKIEQRVGADLGARVRGR